MIKKIPEKFKEFVLKINEKDNIGIIFDGDPDGLCSGTIIFKAIQKITGKKPELIFTQGKENPWLNKKTAEKLKEKKINNGISINSGSISNSDKMNTNEKKSLNEKKEVVYKKHKELNFSNNEKVDKWNQVIEEVKKMGKMLIYTNLLNSSAIWLNNKQIGVILADPRGFSNTVLKKYENLEIVQKILFEIYDAEIKVKYIEGDEDLDLSSKVNEESDFVKKVEKIAKDIPINLIDD